MCRRWPWDLGKGWAQKILILGVRRFTEWPRSFEWNCLPEPSSTECLFFFQWKAHFSSLISASPHPLPQGRLPTLPRLCQRWFPNGGSLFVWRSSSLIYLNLNATSSFNPLLPHAYSCLASLSPHCNSLNHSLTGKLEAQLGNYGLQTLVS